jgi:AcrR family transcriptional regulator
MAREPSNTRDRVLAAAYELFSTRGVGAVGVDAIVKRSGVAKMSLYRHFKSKEGLVLAFLERREQSWTVRWLEEEIVRRVSDPNARLLAIFDALHDWFQRSDFEGCSFINVMLESEYGSPTHRAATGHLSNIRSIVERLATEAALNDPGRFAQAWHILMNGAIVAAHEGNRNSAREAQHAGVILLKSWPRAVVRSVPVSGSQTASP